MSQLPLRQQVSLQSCNTLAIDACARYLLEVTEPGQIPAAVAFAKQQQLPLLVLGGGSNVVLSRDFPGVVLRMALRGIDVIDTGHDDIVLDVAAGENWHQLVEYCLQQGCHGLENLALIPGTAGAAPIQNIGAYGVELESLLESVSGWDIAAGEWRTLSAAECRFGYRDSIFKGELRDRFIITAIRLRLKRSFQPQLHYRALADYLQQAGIAQPTPQQLVQAVIDVRRSKLPDPALTPNAGSFFKNPVVSAEQYAELVERFPQLVSFPQPDGGYKLAAGWLLEQAGWKGAQRGAVGVHDRQSLVLVNRDGGSGTELLALAEAIRQDVRERFGVELEIEPRVY